MSLMSNHTSLILFSAFFLHFVLEFCTTQSLCACVCAPHWVCREQNLFWRRAAWCLNWSVTKRWARRIWSKEERREVENWNPTFILLFDLFCVLLWSVVSLQTGSCCKLKSYMLEELHLFIQSSNGGEQMEPQRAVLILAVTQWMYKNEIKATECVFLCAVCFFTLFNKHSDSQTHSSQRILTVCD